jgi:5-methylcytosine-specific restriction protein A
VMPKLPEPFRARPKAQDERSWASRQIAARQWYASRTWLALRTLVMVRDAYMCRACGVSTGQSAHIDHIVPHSGDWERFTDEANLQTLCASCHSAKTVRERGGIDR